MSKHTPGPWTVLTGGQAVQIGTRYIIASTNEEYPISLDDAKLIAAAPATAADRDRLRSALLSAAHFIENVPPDDPQRNDLFFKCREVWRNALANTPPAPAREAAPAKADHEVIETAADLAFGHIQEHLGVTDGGTAAMFWSGEEEEQFHAQMLRYIAFERALGEHSDEAGG